VGNETENTKLNVILLLLNVRMICAKTGTSHERSRCVVAEDVITCLLLGVLVSWVDWLKH
jgi:hypothetical protein